MSEASITKELINSVFYYKNGFLFWKETVGQRGKKDTIAGSFDKKGYVCVKYNGKMYKAHRLIFLMHYGYLVEKIDHEDGNPSNNCINNLRPASSIENGCNSKLSKKNTSGVKGVSWHKLKNKYDVKVSVNGVRKHFGSYNTLEEAKDVAIKVRVKYHKQFARHL